jgi:hypothetical protein
MCWTIAPIKNTVDKIVMPKQIQATTQYIITSNKGNSVIYLQTVKNHHLDF